MKKTIWLSVILLVVGIAGWWVYVDRDPTRLVDVGSEVVDRPCDFDGRVVRFTALFHGGLDVNLFYFEIAELKQFSRRCVVMAFSDSFAPPADYASRFEGRRVEVEGILHCPRANQKIPIGAAVIETRSIRLVEEN